MEVISLILAELVYLAFTNVTQMEPNVLLQNVDKVEFGSNQTTV